MGGQGDAVAGQRDAVAAIDCGTNSTRLLVADATGATLTRRMQITRLGQGVAATGRLAPEAVQRTIEVLRGYRRVMDDLGVGATRISATSAARDAANREELFAAIETAVGAAPELLTGQEEGQLSFVGATAGLDPGCGPFLVVDIGGGSTEMVAGPGDGVDRFEVTALRSLDVGCVRVTETYLSSDPPAPGELVAAHQAVRSLIGEAVRDVPAFVGPATLVGLAGTVSALCRLDQGLQTYDRDRVHQAWLSRDAVDRWLRELGGQGIVARRQQVGMEDERADVIVGGAVVLAELMWLVGAERCLVSESDILDGLAMSLLDGT